MNTLRGYPREPEHGPDVIGVAIGVVGAIVMSILMLPLRGHLHNDNMALALVIPVLVGAVIGGRIAGVVSAVAAALCFDFFFTAPYLSLRIAGSNDLTSMFVLLVVALIAAEVGIGRGAAAEPRARRDRISTVCAESSISPPAAPSSRTSCPRRAPSSSVCSVSWNARSNAGPPR